MSKLPFKMQYVIWRACYEIWAYPYYVLLVTVMLLWIGEGVAEQSGAACPVTP